MEPQLSALQTCLYCLEIVALAASMCNVQHYSIEKEFPSYYAMAHVGSPMHYMWRRYKNGWAWVKKMGLGMRLDGYETMDTCWEYLLMSVSIFHEHKVVFTECKIEKLEY